MDLAKEKQVAFEVCPSSNFQSGVIQNLTMHPLSKMVSHGLSCSINTDDPGISQIDLSREYELGCEVLGISRSGLKNMIIGSISKAFLINNEKKILQNQMIEELKNF